MSKRVKLLYFSSNTIVKFCSKNPLNWYDSERHLANRDGPGNILTPTPGMEIFYDYLLETGSLFTQDDFVSYAWNIGKWKDWRNTLSVEAIRGTEVRLCRNFYPSGIDTLHVWSLLVESGKFKYCVIDIIEDATSKTDIIVFNNREEKIKIGLSIASMNGEQWRKYKRKNRDPAPSDLIDIKMDLKRPKFPGNKRWYTMKDIMNSGIIKRPKQLAL